MRSAPEPSPIEHTWHLAALSVVGRAQDYEFLIGSPWAGRANKNDEILHLEHTIARFPKDRRLLLAQGIAAEWRLFPNQRNSGLKEALDIFDNLRNDAEVGAEASLRLGVALIRTNRSLEALPHLAAAARVTREPFIKYLAQVFTAQALETQKQPDQAEAAYRAALVTIPNVQSAVFPLAAILAEKGKRAEGAALVAAAISASPRPLDPWREYGGGDDRYWPERIAELRKEIRR
jgi:tetratricopeptide (TPR) repeat protein